MIELAGNRTLIMFSNALAGLVDEHLSLAQRRNTIDPEFSMRQLRYGLKSHSKLADLIEAKDGPGAEAHWKEHMRSEEHTSELQSLMRNSYAVFCLKKKIIITY